MILVIGFFNVIIPSIVLFGVCVFLPFSLLVSSFLFEDLIIHKKETDVAKLKPVEFVKDGNTGDLCCTICSLDYEEHDKIIVLPCNLTHFFHEKCIGKWLCITPQCPVCRAFILP